jgi:cyclopropane-fatty-acyl-phospholipid synthase
MLRLLFIVTLSTAIFFTSSCNHDSGSNKTIPISSSNPQEVVTELLALADIKIDGDRAWDIQVHNPDFYNRVLVEGSLGLGESYTEGWWDCTAIDEMIYRLLNAKIDEYATPTWGMRWAIVKAFFCNLQDKIGSKEVIDAHYQLGNELFTSMLDSTMMYTCAYWKKAKTLDAAQKAKLDLICRKLGLKPGMKVLDIGCGWGGFEKYAAQHYGASVVGITLSENQAVYARDQCKGLPVEILVKDYRDVEGSFDRVVSIGMFEHVGSKNYRDFFNVVEKLLKPDGLFLLHTIGRDTSVRVTDPWIHKYIFPNGQLPSPEQITGSFEGLFMLEDWHNFGASYDKTLMAWYASFAQNWPKLQATYGDAFYRMWKYYLLSCAGAFRARKIQLWQLVLSPQGVEGGYKSVR